MPNVRYKDHERRRKQRIKSLCKEHMGDALNGLLLLENEAVKKYMIMHPSQNYLSTNTPETGTLISLPKQAVCIWNAFLGKV